MDEGKKRSWEVKIEEKVCGLAKTVLYELNRWEFDDLASRDPSFESVARDLKKSIQLLDELGYSRLVTISKEVVEILESTAQSIVDRDVKLLIDNTAHLQEFVEIRENEGAANEN